jgi:hypothetical protein
MPYGNRHVFKGIFKNCPDFKEINPTYMKTIPAILCRFAEQTFFMTPGFGQFFASRRKKYLKYRDIRSKGIELISYKKNKM